jgi:hypothetical protein
MRRPLIYISSFLSPLIEQIDPGSARPHPDLNPLESDHGPFST